MADHHVCPWWVGYLLLFPLRKLFQNPERMLTPYVKKNMKVLDFGSAMGYFSIPMAQMVGTSGKVYCAEVQQRMLDSLMARASKKDLGNIIEPRLVTDNSSNLDDLENQLDFGIAFAVMHELPDKKKGVRDIKKVLKNGAFLYLAEPKGHVKSNEFEATIKTFIDEGFEVNGSPKLGRVHSSVLKCNK